MHSTSDTNVDSASGRGAVFPYIAVPDGRAMRHRTNIRCAIDLVFHTIVAAARTFVRHWTNIRPTVHATVAVLLFANVAVARKVLVQRGTNIRTREPIFLRELLVVSARRILVRHRTNIRPGEDLLLARSLLITRVVINVLRRMYVRT